MAQFTGFKTANEGGNLSKMNVSDSEALRIKRQTGHLDC